MLNTTNSLQHMVVFIITRMVISHRRQKKCFYWSRNASLVVSKELERLIDYTKDYDLNSRFSSLASSGLTIVAGADQGNEHGAH